MIEVNDVAGLCNTVYIVSFGEYRPILNVHLSFYHCAQHMCVIELSFPAMKLSEYSYTNLLLEAEFSWLSGRFSPELVRFSFVDDRFVLLPCCATAPVKQNSMFISIPSF